MNILVADDDRMCREMLRRAIETDPAHQVTLAEDGEQAWKLLCESNPQFDVGILDINMPRVDGIQLVERIRATPGLRNTMVILCTATANRTIVQKASALAVSHYIVKPYNKNVVVEKLKTVQDEIAKRGLENLDDVLKRLKTDRETYQVLVMALLDDLAKWIKLCRYTSDVGKFTRLAGRSPGLRGACATFGLASLINRLDEVEFTLANDSAASQGQQSPLLLSQVAPIFEGLEEEVKRVTRQMTLTE